MHLKLNEECLHHIYTCKFEKFDEASDNRNMVSTNNKKVLLNDSYEYLHENRQPRLGFLVNVHAAFNL